MANARGCGIVGAILQGIGLGLFREFSGYTIPIEQSDRNTGTGHRDIVH